MADEHHHHFRELRGIIRAVNLHPFRHWLLLHRSSYPTISRCEGEDGCGALRMVEWTPAGPGEVLLHSPE